MNATPVTFVCRTCGFRVAGDACAAVCASVADTLLGPERVARPKGLEPWERWNEDGWLFPSSIGTLTDPENFSHAFAALCRRAGLGRWQILSAS
jgi:hypothetical protein